MSDLPYIPLTIRAHARMHTCQHPCTNARTLLVRSLVAAVPCGIDTAWPRSCCSRAYASNSDCDCAVPALLSAASQLEVHSGRCVCIRDADTGLDCGSRPAAGKGGAASRGCAASAAAQVDSLSHPKEKPLLRLGHVPD